MTFLRYLLLDLGYTAEHADGNIDYNDVYISDGEEVTTGYGETEYHEGGSETDGRSSARPAMARGVVDYIDYTGPMVSTT